MGLLLDANATPRGQLARTHSLGMGVTFGVEQDAYQ
jgi:hypothetical protein